MLKRSIVAVMMSAFVLGLAGAADEKKKDAKKGPDLEKAFNMLDASSNGKLSLEEFKNLKSVIPQDIDKEHTEGKYDFDAMLKKLDTDKDGVLSLDEFKKVKSVIPAPVPKKKKK